MCSLTIVRLWKLAVGYKHSLLANTVDSSTSIREVDGAIHSLNAVLMMVTGLVVGTTNGAKTRDHQALDEVLRLNRPIIDHFCARAP